LDREGVAHHVLGELGAEVDREAHLQLASWPAQQFVAIERQIGTDHAVVGEAFGEPAGGIAVGIGDQQQLHVDALFPERRAPPAPVTEELALLELPRRLGTPCRLGRQRRPRERPRRQRGGQGECQAAQLCGSLGCQPRRVVCPELLVWP
jgi:hypothetical protein